MNGFLIVCIFILLFLIPFLLFEIFKNRNARIIIDTYERKAQPYVLFIIGMAFIISVFYFTLFVYNKVIPPNASFHGILVEQIFKITFYLTGIVFLITQFLLFFLPLKYRAEAVTKVHYILNNIKVEIIWIAVPLFTFIFLFTWGQTIWIKMNSPLNNPLEIEIVAEQFNWFVRYPGKDGKLGDYNIKLINNENKLGINMKDKHSLDDFLPIQIHVPKNRAIKIHLRSKDVIHSLNIPHMKLKMDLIPGMKISTNFIATVTTQQMRKLKKDEEFNYEVSCAELCGRMHFAMSMILIVEEEAEFEKWYKAQTPLNSKFSEHSETEDKLIHQTSL